MLGKATWYGFSLIKFAMSCSVTSHDLSWRLFLVCLRRKCVFCCWTSSEVLESFFVAVVVFVFNTGFSFVCLGLVIDDDCDSSAVSCLLDVFHVP